MDEKSCVTPAGTSNELDVQNEWEENTHTHNGNTQLNVFVCSCLVLICTYSRRDTSKAAAKPPQTGPTSIHFQVLC